MARFRFSVLGTGFLMAAAGAALALWAVAPREPGEIPAAPVLALGELDDLTIGYETRSEAVILPVHALPGGGPVSVSLHSLTPSVLPDDSRHLEAALGEDGRWRINITPAAGATGMARVEISATQDGQTATGRFQAEVISAGGQWVRVPPTMLPQSMLPGYSVAGMTIGANSFTPVAGFSMMKYEAKPSGVPISLPAGIPWYPIAFRNARDACESLGGNYSLPTERQWLAVAHRTLSQSENWSGNSPGVGFMMRGHSAGTPSGGLAADPNDANFTIGISSPQAYSRRTLNLTGSQVIWDFAGNVTEWTYCVDSDYLIPAACYTSGTYRGAFHDEDKLAAMVVAGGSQNPPGATWVDYDNPGFNGPNLRAHSPVDGHTYTAAENVGRIFMTTMGSGYPAAFSRGGGYNDGVNAGVLSAKGSTTWYPADSYGGLDGPRGNQGFRCVSN
jgi:formylglycine-generating enzyme required for sulfatase activity